MASDDLRARIDAAIRPNMLFGLQDAELHDEPGKERINEWADWISRRIAELVQPELDREAELSQLLMEQRQQMAAERFVWQERGDRYRAAWRSARRRAAGRQLAGSRRPGGAIRQALIDAGIITAEDRVVDAVEKIRALGPQPACKHGVLPEQGLCLYCATEQRATVPGVDACYEIRHCVMWGFCHRCAPELAAEASRLYGHTGGTPQAYAAIVKGLTDPAQHSCGNCDGIDRNTCLNNPDRTKES